MFKCFIDSPCILVANCESVNSVVDLLDNIVCEVPLEMAIDNLRRYPINEELKSDILACIYCS